MKISLLLIGAWLILLNARACAQDTPGKVAQSVRFDQHLGERLPPDLEFRDESGQVVRLGDYFGRKPAILTLVYYRCPMLCGKELESLTRSIRALSIDVGKDFQILTVSISPDETPDLAAAKKSAYMKAYNRPGAERGWHFLTGDAKSIERLADVAGFRYVYNPKTKLYAHAAGLVILTPEGVIAKYISGVEYPANIVQRNLEEAGKGKVGNAIAWITLLCYDYDESTGSYTLAIMRLTRIFGTATALALATYVVAMIRRDRLRSRSVAAALPAAPWEVDGNERRFLEFPAVPRSGFQPGVGS